MIKLLKIITEHISLTTTKHKFQDNNHYLSFSEWIDRMMNSEDLILKFNQCLADSEFEAFFWEVKPVKMDSMDQDFEFVLVDSKSLVHIRPDDSSFKQFFTSKESVVNFPNLRGDAELVVPVPISNKTQYAHIANFVRTAGQDEILAFWRRVVSTYSSKIGDKLKWLSTSGLGVYWLHVRIDSRPKYYQHKAYKY